MKNILIIKALVGLSILSCKGEFFDPMVNDRASMFGYLEGVEEAVGTERFEAVSYERVLFLAKTMGPIDRKGMKPETLVANLQHLGEVESRFYREEPLEEELVRAYLMPRRIRYEATSRPDWPEHLGRHFQSVCIGAMTADECAASIFKWMAGKLVLTESGMAYRLPMRGDLDPMTVLRGGRGSEIDLAIFGVAALRSCGVAARLAWAPALRDEIGGKVWLEYRSEDGKWIPWVPSFGEVADHRAKLRQEIGIKIAMVMAAPDAPIEVTGDYVETVKVRIQAEDPGTQVAFMIVGKEGLMPVRGNALEYARNEREILVGAGRLVVASVSSNRRSFALLPVNVSDPAKEVIVQAVDGSLSVASGPTIIQTTTSNP